MNGQFVRWRNRRGWRPLALWMGAGALLVLALALLPRRGGAVEWTAPPGINVASQEQALKERITRQAQAQIGDALLDVIVHVGYVRMERKEATPSGQRIKLPGLDSYIVGGEAKGPEIVSEFARLRQAFVIAASTMRSQPEALARELAISVGFDRDKGDSLRVITVVVPQPSAPVPAAAEGGPPAQARKGEPPEASAASEGAAKAKPAPDALKEAQSTVYLMKARRSYFSGDFQAALDQILQAITVDPMNAQAYAMLGSLYYAMNWKSLAIKYWERSLEIDPTNREIEDLVTQIRAGTP